MQKGTITWHIIHHIVAADVVIVGVIVVSAMMDSNKRLCKLGRSQNKTININKNK